MMPNLLPLTLSAPAHITTTVISYSSLSENTHEINGKINFRTENELGIESLM